MPRITDPAMLSQLNGTPMPPPIAPGVVIGRRAAPISDEKTRQDMARNAATAPYEAPKAATELEIARAELRAKQLALAGSGTDQENKRISGESQRESMRASRLTQAATLRDDFEKRPAVVAYRTSLPMYAQALQTDPTPAGDLLLVTAYAKLTDPSTGVQARESDSVANAQPYIDATVAKLKNQLGSTGVFAPEMRKDLRSQLASLMAERNRAFIGDRIDYKTNAERAGIDPITVIGEHPGARFQAQEAKFLGHAIHQADYQGNPIPSGTTGDGGAVEGKGPTAPAGMPTLSPSEINEVQSLAKYGGPEATMKWFADHHAPITADNAKAVANYYAKGGTGNPSVQYNAAGYNAKLDAMNAQKDALAPIGKGALAANGMIASASPVLAGGIQGVKSAIAGDGFTPGYELGRDAEARRFDKARKAAGVPGMVAEGGGMALGALLTGGAASRLPGALGARLATQSGVLGSDIAFGSATGGFDAKPGQTIEGVLKGGAAAGAGNLAGRALAYPAGALARSQTIGRLGAKLGLPASAAPQALNPAEGIIAREAGKDSSIVPYLESARDLGVPANLADANPALRGLAGASVRRSPNAAAVAENTLPGRARDQITRLGTAIERDLGPVANITQASKALIQKAQADAAPLYKEAYAAPAVGSPRLEELLATPAARQATSRAHTIAANEMRDPSALGFSLDANGAVTLNPVRGDLYGAQAQARAELQAAQEAMKSARTTVGGDSSAATQRVLNAREALRAADNGLSAAPSEGTAATSRNYTPQTLDYVKRGIDDVIEAQPKNPATGKPILDESTRAIDGVRRQLLQEVDTLNPAYAKARAAYAGPASAREALQDGQSLFGKRPDIVAEFMANQTPSNIPQAQLGFRSEMSNRANNARYSTNPFETVYGSPNMQASVAAVHPEGDLARFGQQADMERNLARTNNEVLGGSQTAGRQVADQQFEGGLGPSMAADAIGASLVGTPPVATAMNLARRIPGDFMKLGMGRKAIEKADGLAPLLLNTQPANTIQMLQDLAARQSAFDNYVIGQRAQFARPIGAIGGGAMLSALGRQ